MSLYSGRLSAHCPAYSRQTGVPFSNSYALIHLGHTITARLRQGQSTTLAVFGTDLGSFGAPLALVGCKPIYLDDDGDLAGCRQTWKPYRDMPSLGAGGLVAAHFRIGPVKGGSSCEPVIRRPRVALRRRLGR